MNRPTYFDAHANLAFERTDTGVLAVRFHTNNGPVVFTDDVHHQFPRALADISDDRDNRVLILTWTGHRFMTDIDGASLGEIFKPGVWDPIVWEGRKVIERLVDLPMPFIAARELAEIYWPPIHSCSCATHPSRCVNDSLVA